MTSNKICQTLPVFQFQFGKTHTRSAPSLSSLPKVALKTVPIFGLNTYHSRPWRLQRRSLPFSSPLSFGRSALSCSGLSMFSKFLKPLSTCALPSRPDVISAVLASVSVARTEERPIFTVVSDRGTILFEVQALYSHVPKTARRETIQCNRYFRQQ